MNGIVMRRGFGCKDVERSSADHLLSDTFPETKARIYRLNKNTPMILRPKTIPNIFYLISDF